MHLPRRPWLTMEAPRTIEAGASFVVAVNVEPTGETSIENLVVRLEEIVGAFGEIHAPRARVISAAEFTFDPPIIKELRSFDFTLAVPRDVIGTYVGRATGVRYELVATAVVPDWFDANVRFGVTCHAALPTAMSIAPHIAAARNQGLNLEVAFAPRTIVPGGMLAGRVVFSDIDEVPSARFVVRLHTIERSATRDSIAATVDHGFVVEGPIAERPIPFEIAIPHDFHVDALIAGLGICHEADVVAYVGARQVAVERVPIYVGAARVGQGETHAKRWSEGWDDVASRVGFLRTPGRLELRGFVEGVAIVIAPTDGADRLEARLHFRSLGIGLELRHGVGHVARPELDRVPVARAEELLARHVTVRAREREQAKHLEHHEVVALLDEPDFVRGNDRDLVIRGAGRLAFPGDVLRFTAHAIELAKHIERARVDMPYPLALGPNANAWRAYAERTHGTIERGSLSLRNARYGDRRFAVLQRFPRGKTEPTHVLVLVAIGAAEIDDEEERTPIAGPLLPNEMSDLRMGATSLGATLRGDLADPALAEPYVAALFAILDRLGHVGSHGPYR